MKNKKQKLILTGYRHPSIGTFTKKPNIIMRGTLYSVAATTGTIAAFPNFTGFFMWPLTYKILRVAGIPIDQLRRRMNNCIRPMLHQRGLLR